jgi:arylsulfatase A-like enzyme
LCEPDHTQHANPLGSPAHRRAIAQADACAASVAETVEGLRAGGDDVLAITCSDHGHETVQAVVPLIGPLVEAGLKADADSHDVVVASNGLSASIYLAEAARPRLDDIARFVSARDWAGQVFAGADLARAGQPTDTALAVTVSTRRTEARNDWGVPGMGIAIADSLSGENRVGCGQHGGLGAFERHPFLFVSGGAFAGARRADAPTSSADIAPTVLAHLGHAGEGMDGRPLPVE